jgi:hypothetical protein
LGTPASEKLSFDFESVPFVLSFTAVCSNIFLVTFTVETEQETDGRWIAEIAQIPGALAYGTICDQAVARVEILGLPVLADTSE